MSTQVKEYYWLAKPGIVYGNAFTAVGGYLLAAKGVITMVTLCSMLVGISLVIASACVFNNYFDRNIDRKMKRTKTRALASGTIAVKSALLYGLVLGLVGVSVLLIGTNLLTTLVGLGAFAIYVFIYTPLKPRSVYATLVGSLAGAAPPVGGYVAVTNHLDSGAVLLFIILVCWQMPHFYAIAIYRLKDYKAAGIPVLPVKANILVTQVQIVLYVVAFLLAIWQLTARGYTGLTYTVVMLLITTIWLGLCVKGFWQRDKENWARVIFRFSLIVLMVFTILLSMESWLP